jgi:hypothetical protein
MPPPESHLSLSEAEKALLKRWIVEGATTSRIGPHRGPHCRCAEVSQ